MSEAKGKDKQQRTLAAYDKFLESQGGAYPATLAAWFLRMSPQGVYNAADRGWITFFQVGRNRWYGKKDLVRYRWEVSKKFKDNRPLPSPEPRKWDID